VKETRKTLSFIQEPAKNDQFSVLNFPKINQVPKSSSKLTCIYILFIIIDNKGPRVNYCNSLKSSSKSLTRYDIFKFCIKLTDLFYIRKEQENDEITDKTIHEGILIFISI